ncbi:hypothetical protein [Thermocrispum municipale]|jgi:hypothetical protein|uniref:hypothetical protein n=1 Tax=Thermocrispum municipale TaxID=37926 RepID=UPI0003FB2470|nr:hypothetical protein [Thermocrispum municipale]
MRSSRAGRIVTTVVAAIVIVTLGVTGWLAWGQHLPLKHARGAPPIGESGRSPVDPMAVAEIGGAKENYATVDSLAAVAGQRMLTREELLALHENGADRVRLAVSKFDSGRAIVLLVQMPSRHRARLATEELAALQRDYGFERADKPTPPGVHAGVIGMDNPAEPGGRAHYQHGDIVVRVEFRGPRRASAEAKFFQVLTAQIQAVEPDD